MSIGSDRSTDGSVKGRAKGAGQGLPGHDAATPSVSPTLRRWELAARLRELRLGAEKSVEDVAAELMCSAAKISRMETAGRGVQPRDIRDLVGFYGLSAEVRDELMQLAEESRRPGWWQEYRTISDTTAQYIGLEAAARDICAMDALKIPGLLQTPAYTAALLERIRLPGELAPELRDEWVEVRQRRQLLLRSGQVRYSSIIDESALARVVGSPEIMAEQIERLGEVAALPQVTLQIVPFSRGAHPALDGTFVWMHFGQAHVGDVVFVENLLGFFLLDKEDVANRYREIYEYISGSVALDPDRSREWLELHLDTLKRDRTG